MSTAEPRKRRRKVVPDPDLDSRNPKNARSTSPVVTLSGGKTERRRPKNKPKSGVRCGKPKKFGGTCNLEAGWGTDHKGIGPCKLHGGDPLTVSAAGRAESARAKYNRRANSAPNKELSHLLGYEVEIDPVNAMLACIRITYGEVMFWDEKLRELDNRESEWFQDTMVGKQLHHYARMKQSAVDRLAKYSKDAMGLGIAERALRLAEAYGSVLAQLFKLVLDDFCNALPPTQAGHYHRKVLREAAESILPQRLLELDRATNYSAEAQSVIDGDYERLT